MLLHRRSRTPPLVGILRRLVLGFSPAEAEFERRGFFLGHPGVRAAAERSARFAIQGYAIALELGEAHEVAARLDMFVAELRCPAYEGAAIGLATLDALRPRFGARHLEFCRGPGAAYLLPVHAGVGMALAASGRKLEPRLAGLDPFARAMVVDGCGFFFGHSRTRATIRERQVPARFAGARERFDCGVGRSLWFVECGDPQRLEQTIASFAADRRGDLWSGVGVAACFLGGGDEALLEALRDAAGSLAGRLARGVALAVAIFERAGTTPDHVELVCATLCGLPAEAVAGHARAALDGLDLGDPSAFASWRERTERRIAGSARASEPRR